MENKHALLHAFTHSLCPDDSVALSKAKEVLDKCLCDFIEDNKLPLFTMDFKSVQDKYLHKAYNALSIFKFNGNNQDILKSADDFINIDSEIRDGLVINVNKLHTCLMCKKRGVSENTSRNVTSHTFIYRSDEAAITKLTCKNCGYKWTA